MDTRDDGARESGIMNLGGWCKRVTDWLWELIRANVDIQGEFVVFGMSK